MAILLTCKWCNESHGSTIHDEKMYRLTVFRYDSPHQRFGSQLGNVCVCETCYWEHFKDMSRDPRLT